jgi:hypothetical protein
MASEISLCALVQRSPPPFLVCRMCLEYAFSRRRYAASGVDLPMFECTCGSAWCPLCVRGHCVSVTIAFYLQQHRKCLPVAFHCHPTHPDSWWSILYTSVVLCSPVLRHAFPSPCPAYVVGVPAYLHLLAVTFARFRGSFLLGPCFPPARVCAFVVHIHTHYIPLSLSDTSFPLFAGLRFLDFALFCSSACARSL